MMKLVSFSTENHVRYVLWTKFSHPNGIENIRESNYNFQKSGQI